MNVIELHPTHPQPRLIAQVAGLMNKGGVIAYPTDSGYALGCKMDQKSALKKIAQLRELDRHHFYTLICRDLSEISQYAIVDNANYRLLKRCTPGPYTFILKASGRVPKSGTHERKKTVGIRVSEHAVPSALVEALGEPLCSTSLILPGEDDPLFDPQEVQDSRIDCDVLLDAGDTTYEPTTVLDLTESAPIVVREGNGDISWLN